jgi:flagellar biosynthetic protein FliQ
MNPQDAIDFSREALRTCMMVGGPILVASLLIALVVGVFQAMTQVQDQTVSFVPKLLLLIVLIGLCLPWLTDQMLEFAKHSFEKPMTQWAGTSHRSLFPKSNTQLNSPEVRSASFKPPARKTTNLSANPVSEKATNDTATGLFRLPNNPLPDAFEISPPAPLNAPFVLPHYRISKAPKSEIGG